MNKLKSDSGIFKSVFGSLLVMGMLVATATAQAELTLKVKFQIEGRIAGQIDGKSGTETLKSGTWTLVIPDAAQGVMTVKSGRKSITVPFTRQKNSESATTDKVTYRDNSDGSRFVASITPRGKDFTLVIAENPTAKN